MQLASNSPVTAAVAKFTIDETGNETQSRYSEYKIIRRNGAVVGFEPAKIAIALTKAFIAVNGGQGAASARVREPSIPSAPSSRMPSMAGQVLPCTRLPMISNTCCKRST